MIRKTLKYFIYTIYGLCGVAVLVFLLPTGLKAKDVATGSMHPAIPQGSLVIIRSVPYSQIGVGDVVTYKDRRQPGQTITHRVVAKTTRSGLPYFTTKGDANPSTDPEIIGGEIIGKVIWSTPNMGTVLTYARQPLGLVMIILIPGLLIIVDESRRMHRSVNAAEAKKAKKTGDPPPPSGGVKVAEEIKVVETEKPKRSMDGMIRRSAIALVVVPILLVGITHAAYRTNTVTLANNRLCVIKTASPSPSPSPSNTSTVTNTNNVTVFNSNHQWGSSGDVNANGNTTTGNVGSGNVSNSNTTTTTITITNSTPSPSPSILPSVSPSPSPSPNNECKE